MPRHIGSRDTRQDPARLKNLLNIAENRLAETGVRPADAKRLLAPARALIADEAFWREQSHGLARFVSQGGMRAFNLPLEPGEHVCAGERFHLFPLLSMFESDRRVVIPPLRRGSARPSTPSRETQGPAPRN